MANTTIPSELIQADVALGGSPTTTTQSAGNNTTKLATTAFVTTAVNNLIASAPGTMDTLNEIAAALNDDPDFTTTVNNAIATKLPLAGGTMTGNIAHASDFTIDAGGNIILDADGGDIKFLDDGTETLRYSSSGSGPQFFSPVADKDIIFKGKDGSSTITALTLDMSNAGDALFNNRVFTSGGTGANTSVNADDLVLGLTNNSTERGITIASTAGGGIRWNDGADAGTLQYVHSTNQMQFYTAGALATVIDSSGNLLVGGTAAINSSSGRGNITISGSSNAILNFGVNNTQKGYIYHTSTDMRFANAVSGAMQFYTSDTERMRIHASGAIQHSAAASVSGVISRTTAPSGSQGLNITASVVTGLPTTTPTFADNSSSGASIYLGGNAADQYGGSVILKAYGAGADGNLIVFENRSGTNTFTERMRIDSSGNVGIGVTPSSGAGILQLQAAKTFAVGIPQGNLVIADSTAQATGVGGAINFTGKYLDNGIMTSFASIEASKDNGTSGHYGAALVFKTRENGGSQNERMRISSGGDLLIGMTANDVAQENGAFIQSANGRYFCSLGSNSLNTYHIYSTVNNSYNFYVNCAGTIYSTNTSISSLSDERLKENIVDIDTGLTEVMSLKPRKFDWKDGNGKDIKNDTGFIAQEVETVLPDLIDGFMHNDLEDAKSVKMGDMIPTLVKAIQEQQTIIDDLKTRIATLEG